MQILILVQEFFSSDPAFRNERQGREFKRRNPLYFYPRAANSLFVFAGLFVLIESLREKDVER